jgi:ArsR family transcriptional regulator, arsenate/arsenite/antimonite-responsive transcriptional repressor
MNSKAMTATLSITKALADVQRLRILMALRTGELCVCQIIEVLGLAPSTVSKHLSILHAAELVNSRKEGRWSYFTLPQDRELEAVKAVLDWLDASLKGDEIIQKDGKTLRSVLRCSEKCLRQRQRSRAAE